MTDLGNGSPGRRLALLSVVAPMRDEAGVVDAFHERVVRVLDGVPFELILVDDGSRDGTDAALDRLADADPRVRVIHLARSFGHQAALCAGMDNARGDAVETLDGDLQDPPEVILDLLERWRAGADVVFAVRQQRAGETWFKLASARWFYRLFAWLSQLPLEHNSGDFRLLDRRAVDALRAMPERNRFLRGMTAWVGFTQTAVPYERDARRAGETKYTLRRMLRLSLDALVSFSNVPLQLATLLGFAVSAIAFLGLPLVIVARFAGIYVPGVSSILFAVLLLGGIQLITVGIIGEYVGRIYDEVKRRPLYVVRDVRNVEGADRPSTGMEAERLPTP